MITTRDKEILKSILFTEQWRVIEQVVEDMVREAQSRPKTADTEWDTIKNTLLAEGEERGIRRLIQQIIELSSK